MPELPEVETVRRGLHQIFDFSRDRIVKVRLGAEKLRVSPALKSLSQVKNQRILNIHRRAKYLLFELESHYLLSHLGMTGSWRILQDKRKHDHVHLYLERGDVLVYNDARRFGMFDVLLKNQLAGDPRFVHLGPDPVVDSTFNGKYLFEKSRKRETSIKAFIMNQQVVVGVGNIYASEALFLAGLHPMKLVKNLTKKQCDLLAEGIKTVLLQGIECGGTTIRDFRQAGGSAGYFQNFLYVYGRDKELCQFCQTPIQSQVIVGRNSFWCPRCQPL